MQVWTLSQQKPKHFNFETLRHRKLVNKGSYLIATSSCEHLVDVNLPDRLVLLRLPPKSQEQYFNTCPGALSAPSYLSLQWPTLPGPCAKGLWGLSLPQQAPAKKITLEKWVWGSRSIVNGSFCNTIKPLKKKKLLYFIKHIIRNSIYNYM